MKTQTIRFTLSAALISVALISTAGCKKNQPATIVDNNPSGANTSGVDPAAANMAPVDPNGTGGGTYSQPTSSTQVLGTSQSYTPQQSGEAYPQQQAPAPVEQAYNNGNVDPNANYNDNNYQDANATDVYANQAPPPLPEYDQPPAPDPDYLWTPGYWDYASTGYYWVPGAWTAPPYRNALWTPPYWGFYGGRYGFHHGYWGLHIGYYGGVDYGFGYIGHGYYGGYWNQDHFYYNRSVNNIRFNNYVYDRPVVVNNVTYRGQPVNRVSYNGPGGVQYRPQPSEIAALREQHVAPMRTQQAVREEAATNRGNFYAQNQGHPQQAVFTRPVAAVAAPAPVMRGGFNRPGQPNVPQPQQRGVAPQQAQQQQLQQRQAQQQQAEQVRQHPLQPERGTVAGQQPSQQRQAQQQAVQQRQQPVQQQHPEQVQQQQRQAQQPARPQPAAVQPRPQPAPRPQARPQAAPQPRPQAAPQPRPEAAPRPAPQAAPQPRAEAPRPAPAPHPEAPHAAPAPAAAPHAEAPHAEGGHPR